ncbi:NUDIX hydrolase [Euzebya sp.]|uniref:NUDIX hydrolase n=1 Tax=Euzebya sp. TaxID=1971409 RepID=UPI0035194F40
MAARSAGPLTSVDVDVVALTLSGGQLADGEQLPSPHVWVEPDDTTPGRRRLPGRPLTPADDLEGAARGVLAAIGIDEPRHLEQLASFGAPDRVPGRHAVSVSYLALIPEPHHPPAHGTDGGWVPAAQQAAGDLAWDHATIVEAAVQRVRSKLSYSNIAYGLLPDEFTMSELQLVYEAVLGTTLDKRNFRRKVTALGLLSDTGRQRRGSHRPARLYTFTSAELVLLDDVIATS